MLKRRGSAGVAGQRSVARARRHFRGRKQITGTPSRPRLVVTRSLRHIVAQVVDDTKGHTIASASTMDPSLRGTSGSKSELATKVGTLLAERATEAGITEVIFDRGGNTYAGRIAALADAARAGGLRF
ncbi:50S ribosomal protein L18 [Natronosporangium hydrolyticum]|uniref:50S ribosomal protein L18 n=1 Tax=Natronosporangium hydrolyticum TaxID=2811111 RepID=UPI001EFA1BCA